MPTYLLTWNPEKWSWDDLDDVLNRVNNGQTVLESWSCASKKPAKGDRVFLLKQGRDIRGIMASGRVTKTEYIGHHYNEDLAAQGRTHRYIDFKLEHLLDPQEGNLLFTSDLQRLLPDGPANFCPQCSGVSVESSTAKKLEILWAQHLKEIKSDAELWAFEGEEKRYFTLHRKRESSLREAKIAEVMAKNNGNLECEVARCGFNFARVYGEVGLRYAQVHHTVPLAQVDGTRETRLKDLKVVCANCHAMIHRGGQCREMDTLISSKR